MVTMCCRWKVLMPFCFDVSVDTDGQITSPLPTLDQIEKAKGHWSNNFKTFFRLHP